MAGSGRIGAEPSRIYGNAFRISQEYTFSWWVVILFIVPSLGSNLILDPVRLRGTWLEWLPIGLATYGATAAIFGFAKFAKARWTPRSGLVYALGVYLIIGWFRGLVAYFMAIYYGLGGSSDLLFRLISPPIFAFVGLSVFAALITTVSQQRQAMNLAGAERDHLQSAIKNFQSQHNKMREELLNRVLAIIGPAISDLRQKLGREQNEQNASDLLASLQVTAETIVRPLSHELASTEAMNLQLDVSGTRPQTRRSRMKYYEPELMPGWGALLSMVMVLPSLAVNHQIVDAAMNVLLLSFTLFINLKVLEGYTAHFRLTPLRGMFIVIGGYTISGAVAPLYWAQTRWHLMDSEYLNFALIVVGIGVAIYGIGVANASRILYIDESFKANEAMALLLSQLKQQVWLDRRRVATVLHGPVQGALQSAAIRIARNGPSEELAEQIRVEILDSIDQLQDGPREVYDFEEVLDHIVALWEDVVDFRIAIDDETRTALASNPDASETALEIAREAINNAMKHSSPANIELSLKLTQPGVLSIFIWNDGGPVESTAKQGYGSRLLDELCLEWELKNTKDGVMLEAAIVA